MRSTWKKWRWWLPVRGVVMLGVLAFALAAAPPARAEKRVALVIGIAAYQHAPALANPVNDARDIGEALRRLDFQVFELFNPDYAAFSRGLREFGIQAAHADAALVYYAGHGVQVDRQNYLLPTDANLERERDLLYEAIPLDLMLGEASQAQKIGIVLLDACRNNPFTDRMTRSLVLSGRGISAGAGLARVDNVPRNTVVMMATKADAVSDDGDNGHSPFATALLAHFPLPGLELGLFMRSVRDSVLKATNNRQEPYIFSSLGAEAFYLHPLPPSRPPTIPPVAAMNVVQTAAATPLGLGRPTDPDGTTLSIRITALPRAGEVLVNGRTAALNQVFSVEDFATATYKPDVRTIGPVGVVEIMVENARGARATASLPITVLPAPPVVDAEKTVQVRPVQLGIAPPRDPAGRPLTVIVTGLPRGVVRNGPLALKTGDRLPPEDLANLTFVPEPGVTGAAGTFRYIADDGHGGQAEGRVNIQIPDIPADPEALLWNRILVKGDPADLDAFLRLFPDSRLAAEARQRRQSAGASVAAAATSLPVPAAPRSEPAAPPLQPAAPPPQLTAPPLQEAMNTSPPRTLPAAPPPGPAAAGTGGNTFRDCPNCPVMTRVPAGSFVMGYGAREREAMPAHPVSIRAFALGQYPVTVGEWKACMGDGGCSSMPPMSEPEDRTPVYNLSWDDTQEYIAWLSRRSGKHYRLPSEGEWEYAARAGTTTPYWWGVQPGTFMANCADCGGHQEPHRPLPVDSFGPNPFGLSDMLGGVAQWVGDCWFPSYTGAPSNGTVRDSRGCLKRVLRGGSFRATHDEITVTARGNYNSPVRYIVNGFRVARELD